MPICNDIIKERTIQFRMSDEDQAEKARLLLVGVEGIELLEVSAPDRLHIRYDVQHMTLHMIESALRDVGFALEDSVLNNLRRAVYAYCEDALRASLGADREGVGQTLSLQKSVSLDPRPDDWRHYVQD